MSLLKVLRHKHIVAFLGFEQTDASTFTMFVEYVPGGDIASILKTYGALALPVIKSYTKQILLGLIYLHGNNIIHRGM